MTRLSSPLRRMAATAAIIGVTGFGSVALAPMAFASDSGTPVTAHLAPPALQTVLPLPAVVSLPTIMSTIHLSGTLPIQSPLPSGPVTLVLGAHQQTLPAQLARSVQTVAANVYSQLGYQVAFTSQGVLVVGNKICDPAKATATNAGCVAPTTSRF
jgi:hypothetical protein